MSKAPEVVLVKPTEGASGEEYREREGRASVSPKFLLDLVYSPLVKEDRRRVYHRSAIFWIEVIVIVILRFTKSPTSIPRLRVVTSSQLFA